MGGRYQNNKMRPRMNHFVANCSPIPIYLMRASREVQFLKWRAGYSQMKLIILCLLLK